jgi:hypothetical protein
MNWYCGRVERFVDIPESIAGRLVGSDNGRAVLILRGEANFRLKAERGCLGSWGA